ncbi:hypothetical protein BpHYR1_036704 [Brachionus plicatilis]|uniref:Uncharacterized protein n=1 Tax=Brachionus plicatilis TaxID=10195 RepID=A0A3M7QXN0_BRAPC|nr:hypothetical protein BpHYR1_036704 [Brachionus plicatilis]
MNRYRVLANTRKLTKWHIINNGFFHLVFLSTSKIIRKFINLLGSVENSFFLICAYLFEWQLVRFSQILNLILADFTIKITPFSLIKKHKDKNMTKIRDNPTKKWGDWVTSTRKILTKRSKTPELQRQPSENSDDFALNQDAIMPNPKLATLEPFSRSENAMNTIQPNQAS